MVKLCSIVLALARRLVQCDAKSNLDLRKRIATSLGESNRSLGKIAKWVQFLQTIGRLRTAPPGPLGALPIRGIPNKKMTWRRTMRAADAALQIKVPRNKTVLMQLLQLLVFRRHYWWCGGVMAPKKLGAFVAKMAVRYPIIRTARG